MAMMATMPTLRLPLLVPARRLSTSRANISSSIKLLLLPVNLVETRQILARIEASLLHAVLIHNDADELVDLVLLCGAQVELDPVVVGEGDVVQTAVFVGVSPVGRARDRVAVDVVADAAVAVEEVPVDVDDALAEIACDPDHF